MTNEQMEDTYKVGYLTSVVKQYRWMLKREGVSQEEIDIFFTFEQMEEDLAKHMSLVKECQERISKSISV